VSLVPGRSRATIISSNCSRRSLSAIDPIREELVTSTETTLGAEDNLFEDRRGIAAAST